MSWEPTSPAAKYGGALVTEQAATPSHTALTGVAGPTAGDDAKPWQPGHPVFWFGAIAAAAVGLMYASTTVRVGPIKASVSAGNS